MQNRIYFVVCYVSVLFVIMISSLKNLHQNKNVLPRLMPLFMLEETFPTYLYCFFFLFPQAKGKERQWLKNQALGELDDAKIIDGLTGEKAIYKRRGELDPEVCVYLCVCLGVCIAADIEPTLKLFFFFSPLPEPHLQTHIGETYTHNFDLYLSDVTFQWCV